MDGGANACRAEKEIRKEEERHGEGDEQSTDEEKIYGNTLCSLCGEETESTGGESGYDKRKWRITVKLAAAAKYSSG